MSSAFEELQNTTWAHTDCQLGGIIVSQQVPNLGSFSLRTAPAPRNSRGLAKQLRGIAGVGAAMERAEIQVEEKVIK